MSELGHGGLPSRFWSAVDGGLMSEAEARAVYAAEPAQADLDQDDGRVAALQSMLHTLIIELGQVRTANAELVQRVAVLEAVARRSGALG